MAECAVEKAAKTPAVEVMTPPAVVEKRPHANGHASPVRLPANQSSPAGKQTEMVTATLLAEKKPQTNGHASPVRLPANSSSPSDVEGYLKTDDRMRLAKERREEREKSLAAREQAIREKERRAQLQYERTVEERWRRLEEQRQKEELRRAAVEEKRRQRLEEEKERLEALMRRSLERSLQLEQRSKRWTWGSPGGTREGEYENAPPPRSAALPHDLAAPPPAASEISNAADSLSASTMTLPQPLDPSLSKRLSSSSATIVHTAERAPPSPHRSPYRGSPSRAARRKASTGSPGVSEDNRGAGVSPETPKKTDKLLREKRTASPVTGSPLRRPESPATVSKRPASPAASRMMSKSRAQSPCTLRENPSSPMKHRAANPSMDGNRKCEGERGNVGNQDTRAEEARGHNTLERKTVTPNETPKMETPEKTSKVETPENKNPKVETPEKKSSKAETPENKNPKVETPEKKSSKVETPEKKTSKTETPEKKTSKVETPEKKTPKSSNSDLSGDRSAEPSPMTPTGKPIAGTTDAEEASRLLAERRRQARLQKEQEDKQRREQEEEERMRVEMLRRRQAEARAWQEEEMRRAEKEKQRQEQERRLREEEERQQRENHEKELQKQLEREREEGELQAQKEAERQRQERELLKQQEEQERQQRKKRIEEIMKRTRKGDAEMKKEDMPTEPLSSASSQQSVPSLPPGPQGAVQVNAQLNAKVNGQVNGQSLVELGESEDTGTKPATPPAAAPPAATQPVPPLINLEPLEVKKSDEADEVQSMEVSPVSKEELISIPEFSPIDEVHHNGMSNTRALEDLLDLTGHVAYPKLSPGSTLGDCNKNLIDGFCSPVADTKLIQPCAPSSDKRNVQ